MPCLSLVAALLLFRVIYYLLPLFVALLLLAGNEIALQRAAATRMWKAFGRLSGNLVAGLLAWATLIAGAVLLVSGALPALQRRQPLLEGSIPLPLIEVSHFTGSIVGALLLLLALGLHRRLDTAWWLAVGLLIVGVVTSVLKGMHFEDCRHPADHHRVADRLSPPLLPPRCPASRTADHGVDRRRLAGCRHIALSGTVRSQARRLLDFHVVAVHAGRRRVAVPAEQRWSGAGAVVLHRLEDGHSCASLAGARIGRTAREGRDDRQSVRQGPRATRAAR